MNTGAIAVIALVLFIGFAARVIWLQLFLSKKEGKWLGLILPIVSFCLATIIVLGLIGYMYLINTKTITQTLDENGQVISESILNKNQVQTRNTESNIVGIIYTFILCNIPTIVLLAIYFSCRENKRQQLALEKMSVQDLE